MNPNDEPLLPIKVVIPHDTDFVAPTPGGSDFEPIDPVTPEVRASLSAQVRQVQAALEEAFADWDLPGVAKVKLKDQALAKTKRPSEIINGATCPVIGCNQLGELYVSVTPDGLRALERELTSNETKRGTAHISTIERIDPCRPEDGVETGLFEKSDRNTNQRLRCRLYRHQDQAINEEIDRRFLEHAKTCGVTEVTPLRYAEGIKIFALEGVTEVNNREFSKFIGLQKLDEFPAYRVVRTASIVHGPMTTNRFPPPDPNRDYPVVGIIDSGTDPTNVELQKWVLARQDWVLPADQDNGHGTFVAGLLANARALNHNDPLFPDAPCKIVDVVAFDKAGEATEDQLLIMIDDALDTWPDVRVWNLSIGGRGTVCKDHEFSEFAAALDQRMEEYDVLFVIAAGNYASPPYRNWPPQAGLRDVDRISPPADSIRGLTVGSVAHKDTPNTVVQVGHPSPFTRRGPGAAYAMKPEVSFPGGNCDRSGDYLQTGVLSVYGNGSIAENIGTSFATPLASAVAAHVFQELEVSGEIPSPALVKGLMVHSAFVKNPIAEPDDVRYYGLKDTFDPKQIVQCSQSSATIIISATVNPKSDFGKRPFPLPPCLETPSGLLGEIFMTLIYNPPLDRKFGIEYCRCNVKATLGSVTPSPTPGAKPKYSREVHPAPEKKAPSGFDKDMVEHGYKWSPLKLYHRAFQRGPTGKQWRLTLDALNRAEFAGEHLDVIILITIRSPLSGALVYDEMVQEMNRLGWGAQDLRLRSAPPRQRG